LETAISELIVGLDLGWRDAGAGGGIEILLHWLQGMSPLLAQRDILYAAFDVAFGG